MPTFNVPVSITYETKGVTPIADIIAALTAAEDAIQDAVSLLPSMVKGLVIEHTQINVRSLTQESPLRELLLVSLVVAFQKDLTEEVPPLIESLLGIQISDSYDSIVTVATMVVVFYGVAFLKDIATKAVQNGALRSQFDELVEVLALRTGKTAEEIKAILDAKYSKPNTVKRLSKFATRIFLPSQKEGAAPMVVDRKRIEPEVIREVPFAQEFDSKEDFERYEPKYNISLEIHAQDRDKTATGWAAIPRGISDNRLKMKLIEPVTASDIWNKDAIVGDVTIVSRLTSDGYVPVEIHLTNIHV